MATQITATLPALDFPREVDYPTQEDWAAFSAAAELNFGILGSGWSTQMQLWKDQANAMSIESNNNADIAQAVANYQGDWVSQGYTLGQTVSVSGVYYICKLTHTTGQNPTAVGSLYWNLALGNWSLKVNNYGNETIAGIKTFTSSPIVPTPTTDTQAVNKAYVDGKYSGFKNYIINGRFDVWQRGDSVNIASGEVRCTDMFLAYSTATTPTASRDSGSTGFYNSLKISGANSLSNKRIIHRIEAINSISMGVGGNTKITFSLWLKADVNSTVKVAIRVPNTSDIWSSYTIAKISNDIQITTSWDRYSVTFDLDFGYWGGIALDVYTTTAQTSLWTTGWQLEHGSVATPFEYRPYGLELSLCQRYYLVSQITTVFYGTTGMGWQQSVLFSNIMRTVPTIVITNSAGNQNIGTLSSNANVKACIIYGTVVSNSNTSVSTSFTASAEL